MAVGRKRRRRGKKGCLSTLFLLLCVAVLLWASIGIFFRINKISVTGTSKYTSESIAQASGIETGDNLIFFNKYAAVRRVLKALPYVDKVEMTRILPNELGIEVTECQPMYYYSTEDGGYWLLSDKGKLLEKKPAGNPGELIALSGLELLLPVEGSILELGGDGLETEVVLEIMSLVSASSAGEAVTAIDFERSYNIVITYGDRFTVELGMPENLEYKLTYLDEVFAKLGEEKKGRIDLSKLMEKGVVYYYEN